MTWEVALSGPRRRWNQVDERININGDSQRECRKGIPDTTRTENLRQKQNTRDARLVT